MGASGLNSSKVGSSSVLGTSQVLEETETHALQSVNSSHPVLVAEILALADRETRR